MADFYDGPIPDQTNALPNWPEHATDFRPLEIDAPKANNEEEDGFRQTHFPSVRIASRMLLMDREALTKMITGLSESEGHAENLIDVLLSSRDVLQHYWWGIEVALSRMSIVLNRNLLKEDDEEASP